MIIGKSITTLGGGGATSTIIVTAPTGSTITLTTPGGVVIPGTEISGTWTFSGLTVLGTYTVNASLSGKSKSQSVIVNTPGLYNVSIEFVTYLYNLGDECTDITGGWSLGNMGVLQKNANNMLLTSDSATYVGCVFHNKIIDLSQYSKMCFDFSVGRGTNQYADMRCGNNSQRTDAIVNFDFYRVLVGTGQIERQTYHVDISYKSNMYVGFMCYICPVTIYKVWLE